MKRHIKSILIVCLVALSGNLALAQQDCFDAIYVCNSSYTQNTAYTGVGAEQEVPPATTCLGNGEVNSVWYRFTVYNTGSLTFQLNPLNPNDDYDFALFNLTNDSCSGILNGTLSPISCNYSSSVGATGLSNGGIGNSNGSSGPNQNASLNVIAGESYALMVSNFTASQSGYSLDFGGSASVADNASAVPDSISLANICNPKQVVLFFTEEFNCSSISGTSEITVTGPSGVNVTQVVGLNCNGGTTDRLRIRFQDKIMVTGTYTITINSGSDGNTFTDGCNNQIPAGTTFTFNIDNIGPDVSVTNVVHTNCGLDQGSAEAVVLNGTPPFNYNWNSSPTQNTQIATGLGPGTYRVRVTDANGCQERVNVVIQNNSPFNLTNNSSTDVTCFGGSDGTAQLIPTGGQAPYSISWSTTPTQTGQNATGLPAGTVTVTITDNTGCTEELDIDINQPNAISIDVATVRPDCGFANGSLTAAATGGTGTYTYEWNTNPIQNTASVTGVSAGVYTVIVDDQSGCSSSENIILTNNFAPSADITDRVPDCGQATGSVTVIPTSGTAPYTYSWNSTPPQTGATATGLTQGDYFVTITDANNCIQIMNVKVDSVSAPSLNLNLTQPGCGLSDGQIEAAVTNGISPFTYTWSSSANGTEVESNLPEGTYTVSVTDSIGCTDSETVSLTQSAPESEFQADGVCFGEESIFQSQSNATPTSWYWDFGDGMTSTLENPTHQYAAAGDYLVTAYFIGGCQDDTVIQTVSVYAPPTADFLVSPEVITTRTDAQFNYTGTGGSSFVWDFGNGVTSTDASPTHQYNADGFYTIALTATDANGCFDTSSVLIEVLLQPAIYFPNAFMPNGRYENQVFKGYGLGVVSAELSIYNRWGMLVYQSVNTRDILLHGWDGTFAGEDSPQGVYAYRVKADFYNNSSFEKLGTVTLIR
ncbi:MAG: gliding motility-associated C-terminal domain-containing protein [Flavobacteriales bacterium]|nr:gliding motility-associated C-terminal domain-containing protein [Flavobacteriales bacterium]